MIRTHLYRLEVLEENDFDPALVSAPADQTLFGFWFAIGLIVVACASLWAYFKARDWL